MAWRLHLTDNAIHRVDVLPGTTDLLCVWSSSKSAVFFQLGSGISAGAMDIVVPVGGVNDRGSDAWHQFVSNLKAPNGAVLPVVRTNSLTIHNTYDGAMRLYDGIDGLSVEIEGQELPLGTVDAAFVAVALDRKMGSTAALDEQGNLYLFQQQIPLGIFDMGLQPEPGILPDLVIADRIETVFISDGNQLVKTNSAGVAEKRIMTSYYVGRIACSPNGAYLATSDTETGVIRVYDGRDLTFTHQKFSVDLIAAAQQVQLMADIPPSVLAVSALTINDLGTIAFAMNGTVVVTNLESMDALPRPQSLF